MNRDEMLQDIPTAVISAYRISSDATYTRISSGLINTTWLVEDHGLQLILQKLNRIFDTSVNKKIDQVTKFLSNNLPHVTRLIKAASGELEVLVEQDCWRCLSHIVGQTYPKLDNLQQARSVGKCLGEFHTAMSRFPRRSYLPRASVHNLAKHQGALKASLRDHREHSQYALVEPVAKEILTAIDALSGLPNYSNVVVHGDPKISNFIFNDHGAAISLIDLDTVGNGQLLFELGDAFRSWCNPAGEDIENTTFDIEIFAQSLAGYLEVEHVPLSGTQSEHIGAAIEIIYVELAARFCADALNESYFRWDNSRYASACEHQLIRAKGQLNGSKAVRRQQREIERVVSEARA